MEKRLTNRFNMYKVVRDWLVDNIPALGGLPSFNDTLKEFAAIIDAIALLDEDKSAVTSGVTASKVEARLELEKLAGQTIRILKAYATFSNNTVLLSDVDYTTTQLKRASEQTLLVRAQKIIHHAEKVQADAEAYGLSAKWLSNFKKAHGAFDQKQTSVRSAIVNRKNAGEQLEAQMDIADDLLKDKLDVLMGLAQINNPELYNQYRGARVIIDR